MAKPHFLESAFARQARGLALAWLALLALMLASLGSAYLQLGVGNIVAGLSIAVVKAAIVVWCFMQLRRASAMTRIAAAAGLATLLLLMALSAVDYATREAEPAPYQSPQQIAPIAGLPTDRQRGAYAPTRTAARAGTVLAPHGRYEWSHR